MSSMSFSLRDYCGFVCELKVHAQVLRERSRCSSGYSFRSSLPLFRLLPMRSLRGGDVSNEVIATWQGARSRGSGEHGQGVAVTVQDRLRLGAWTEASGIQQKQTCRRATLGWNPRGGQYFRKILAFRSSRMLKSVLRAATGSVSSPLQIGISQEI